MLVIGPPPPPCCEHADDPEHDGFLCRLTTVLTEQMEA